MVMEYKKCAKRQLSPPENSKKNLAVTKSIATLEPVDQVNNSISLH